MNLNGYRVEEMSHQEMKNIDGGALKPYLENIFSKALDGLAKIFDAFGTWLTNVFKD